MSRVELVEVDLTSVATAKELHVELARALGFPRWYGRNWDAFWDAITGLVEMPRTLRFSAWSSLEARLPDAAAILRRLLERMASENPASSPTVIYE